MTDREHKINEMTKLIEAHSCDDVCVYCKYNGLKNCERLHDMETLYNAGYRKMDEVTLRLDLGDRSAEEIKQIAKAFNKINEEEMEQLRAAYEVENAERNYLEAYINDNETWEEYANLVRKQTAKDIYDLIGLIPIPDKHRTHLHIGFENALSAVKTKIAAEYDLEVK